MGATREDIQRWIDKGLQDGSSHLIVMCDGFDYCYYPVYVTGTPDEVRAEVQERGQQAMQRVMEVYHLAGDLAAQMDMTRAFVYGDEAPGRPAAAAPQATPAAPAAPASAASPQAALRPPRPRPILAASSQATPVSPQAVLRTPRPRPILAAAPQADHAAPVPAARPVVAPVPPRVAGLLERSMTVLDLAGWKLHWFTMEVERVLAPLEDDLRYECKGLLTRENALPLLFDAFDRLKAVIARYHAWVREMDIMFHVDSTHDLIGALSGLPRHVAFMAKIDEVMSVLVSTIEFIQKTQLAQRVENIERFRDHGY